MCLIDTVYQLWPDKKKLFPTSLLLTEIYFVPN